MADSRTTPPRKTASRRRFRSQRALPRDLVQAGLSPRKSLGQHFLTDRRILRRIVSATKLTPTDTVVEVGAGLGVLTAQLVRRAGRVIAVEVDEALCDHLRRRFESASNLDVVCRDVLSLQPGDLLRSAGATPPYVVAGNLPYNIAAAVLRLFLEASERPQRLIVMLQKEVAESIVAKPGRMSLLALSVQLYGVPRLLFTVPPSSFRPPPRVESAVLRIDVREAPAVAVDDVEGFFRFLRAGFSAPRKQLRNALSHALGIDAASAGDALRRAGIDPSLRAQALGMEQWATLYRAFALESEGRS
ncbi:MAG: 16S rRNA (adenine(1518)-N(6)/adenine(1519)-N(6))-dimethyltransferase RsmA [Dehalococcoidia bacterium]|nr:16S rRNA (adenine(1518)-N(6)/adenine(1519)-N(6))-dimethyltransferase RsmA [Dehalococcoidia bacterium]